MGVVDLKAAREVSATDLSCGPALSEMLCLLMALHICRTQVTQPSGTSLLIPGPLCEEDSLHRQCGLALKLVGKASACRCPCLAGFQSCWDVAGLCTVA